MIMILGMAWRKKLNKEFENSIATQWRKKVKKVNKWSGEVWRNNIQGKRKWKCFLER